MMVQSGILEMDEKILHSIFSLISMGIRGSAKLKNVKFKNKLLHEMYLSSEF